MIERIGESQVFEDIVVRGEGRRGEDGAEDGVRGVVERVGGHHRAAVNVSGKDKLDLGRPLLDSFRFRLRPLVVLLEVVWEIAVEVEPSSVVPATEQEQF
jgi:hypothetical protein